MKDEIGMFLDDTKLEYELSKFDDDCWLEAIIQWNNKVNGKLDETNIEEIKKRWGRGFW